MISERDYSTLIAIRDNRVTSENQIEFVDTQRLESLIQRGLVSPCIYESSVDGNEWMVALRSKVQYLLTPIGEDEVSAFEKNAVKDAEREEKERLKEQREDKWKRKDARRSWLQFVINALIAVIFFTLGVLVDDSTPLKKWILLLFGQ